MRLKNLKTILYGAAALMMSACAEEQLETQFQGEAELKANIGALSSAFTAYNGSEQDETRTYIDEHENYESGVGTLWRPKEVIGVYGTSMTNSKFTSTNSKNAATVSFSGSLWGTPKYAYYPYSAKNNGVKQTAVKGNMPSVQKYNQNSKDIVGDYRAGMIDERGWFSSTFTFKRLVSVLKFTVDATGSVLEGDRIHSIAVKVGNSRQMTGNFTINLQTQTIDLGQFEQGDDSLTLIWDDQPTMSAGASYRAYMTVLPAMQSGDNMYVTVTTDKHICTFTGSSKVAYVANNLYNLSMKFKSIPNMVVTDIKQEENTHGVTPKLIGLKFAAAQNEGKILTRTLKYSTSTYKPVGTENKDFAAECTIDTVNMKVSLYLPYLNNRKLIPTFEIPEGTQWLLDDGTSVESNVTEVDFTKHKNITIVNSNGDEARYDVEFTNTGLPVVVVNQKSGPMVSSESGDFAKASKAWYEATGTKWLPKSAEWAMEDGDNFMVYNADGTSAISDKNDNTVEEPLLASTRVRGNITQQMPKKAFAVKLDKKSGIFMNDEDPTNDLPAHKRWVLLANWKDRTMMRNEVAFGLANVFSQTFPTDGIAWNPSGQFVELVYNGVHVGTYYLCEQIKIDGNRLDINDPYDAEDAYSGNPEDYGYLLECDDAYDEQWKFLTKMYIPFLFKDDGNNDMLSYAQNFVRGIEENLYKSTTAGYKAAFEKMDLTSFVDFLLLQELMMNGEIKHPKSCYMYINDGKLYAGPIWDFDWNTLPNSGYIEGGYSYSSLMITKASIKRVSSGYPSSVNTSDANYLWYSLLSKNADFKKLTIERWNKVMSALQTYAANIPAMEEKLRKSEAENWAIWQLDHDGMGNSRMRTGLYGLGGSTYYKGRSTCGYCGDENMSFKQSLENLSNNLISRISGMNTYLNNNYSDK